MESAKNRINAMVLMHEKIYRSSDLAHVNIKEYIETEVDYLFDLYGVENIEINLDTNKTFEIIDITSKINEIIANSNISNGIVNIFSKHSTSAICVNENEEGLLEDLEFVLSNIISNKFSYKHDNIDNNAESHLKSFLLSSSESVPISNNKLNLGTWQSVFFIELDGPRHNRIINITVIGE